MAQFQVETDFDFREDALQTLLTIYEFNEEATRLSKLKHEMKRRPRLKEPIFNNLGTSTIHTQTELCAPYKSCMIPFFISFCQYLAMCGTCHWWCCRWRARKRAKQSEDENDDNLWNEATTTHHPQAKDNGGKKGATEWKRLKKLPVEDSPWYSPVKGMRFLGINAAISLLAPWTNKRRPRHGILQDVETGWETASMCPDSWTCGNWVRYFLCIPSVRTCGTPKAVKACCTSCGVWLGTLLLGPFFLAMAIIVGAMFSSLDGILIPLCLGVALLLVCILVEPIFGCLACMCGMRTPRPGFTLVASIIRNYRYSGNLNGSSTSYSEAQTLASVVLVENVSFFKALKLIIMQSNPGLSLGEALITNPVWGLFESEIPIEAVGEAWIELIRRSGGERPIFVPEQPLWDIIADPLEQDTDS
eukprot:gb/GECG01004615.1/.p1 GENE.gb/GECG01004615.1/~~gb/GECG01004615.1/.p1  ORF type:complete len:417 (+),score=36.14 gb/GECG01004615.1/:1-1251(+)